MRKYVFHLYNYILHVYAERPGGYPEAFLNKRKKEKKEKEVKRIYCHCHMEASPSCHIDLKGPLECRNIY